MPSGPGTYGSKRGRPKKSEPKKGMKSKTMPGKEDFTTKKGSKDFDRGGKRELFAEGSKVKRKPFEKKKAPEKKGKMVEVKVGGGEEIKFRKGGLHKSLKVPMEYKFTKAQIRRYIDLPDDAEIKIGGNSIKKTSKIQKQLELARTLMGFKK